MNSYVIPLPGFDDYSCRVLTYYTWEEYPQFRIVYFIVGLAGAMALKLLCDKVKALYIKTRK